MRQICRIPGCGVLWFTAGLRRYEQHELAREIGSRFLTRIEALFAAQGKLVEQYDVLLLSLSPMASPPPLHRTD
jgi:hypothetical protein